MQRQHVRTTFESVEDVGAWKDRSAHLRRRGLQRVRRNTRMEQAPSKPPFDQGNEMKKKAPTVAWAAIGKHSGKIYAVFPPKKRADVKKATERAFGCKGNQGIAVRIARVEIRELPKTERKRK